MGWATSLVSPPDGDLTAFMSSLTDLQNRQWSQVHSGHGAPITDPRARIDTLIAHRRGREAAILAALSDRPACAEDLAQRIYTETPPALLPAATRNVLAHLIDLVERTLVVPSGSLTENAVFKLT